MYDLCNLGEIVRMYPNGWIEHNRFIQRKRIGRVSSKTHPPIFNPLSEETYTKTIPKFLILQVNFIESLRKEWEVCGKWKIIAMISIGQKTTKILKVDNVHQNDQNLQENLLPGVNRETITTLVDPLMEWQHHSLDHSTIGALPALVEDKIISDSIYQNMESNNLHYIHKGLLR